MASVQQAVQEEEWPAHKEWCKLSKKKQPLAVVYQWFWDEAIELAEAAGDPRLFPPVKHSSTKERIETLRQWHEDIEAAHRMDEKDEDDKVRPGSHVRVVKLQSRPELNGSLGEALYWVAGKERWEVRLDKTQRALRTSR